METTVEQLLRELREAKRECEGAKEELRAKVQALEKLRLEKESALREARLDRDSALDCLRREKDAELAQLRAGRDAALERVRGQRDEAERRAELAQLRAERDAAVDRARLERDEAVERAHREHRDRELRCAREAGKYAGCLKAIRWAIERGHMSGREDCLASKGLCSPTLSPIEQVLGADDGLPWLQQPSGPGLPPDDVGRARAGRRRGIGRGTE